MEGRRKKGSPCTRWLDRAIKACYARSLELRDAKVKCMDREQWRDLFNGTNGGVIV